MTPFKTVSARMAPVLAALCLGCGTGEGETASATGAVPEPGLSLDSYREDLRVLASDEFGGRAPSSPGEELTIQYLADRMAAAGLQPGNDGSFFQSVPLVAMTVQGSPVLRVTGPRDEWPIEYGRSWVGWTKRVVSETALSGSDLVFVGYGIVAPEYGWNDYQGLDMAGKTALILVNDPGFASRDPALFRGNAMTYYGRWTYKFEEAARQGAAGALIVHQTEPAAYGWAVVEGSWTGPQFDLVTDDRNMARPQVEGWIRDEVVAELFRASGHDFEALAAAAGQPGFGPVSLGLQASTSLENRLEESVSHNVIGVLPGSDQPDEHVLYMAHWDHFGTSPDEAPDPVYNGAFDNATGTAGLLELARAHGGAPPTRRSVTFLATTAEEQGLLGSAYYGRVPVIPTHKTVAAINMDGMNVYGPMRDVVVIGWGASELDDYVADAASAAGRSVKPDPEPEKGYYFRSDHFSLAKVGVPAVYPDVGTDHAELGVDWVTRAKQDYVTNRYHTPSDEFDPDWDLSGAMDDLALIFAVGYRLATESTFPNWREDSEFRAIRDRDLAGR